MSRWLLRNRDDTAAAKALLIARRAICYSVATCHEAKIGDVTCCWHFSRVKCRIGTPCRPYTVPYIITTVKLMWTLFRSMFIPLNLSSLIKMGRQEDSTSNFSNTTVVTASLLLGIVLPLFYALLRYLFHPALISRLPIEYEEEVLLESTSSSDKKDDLSADHRPILSIVIPAYNEEERLLIMFADAFKFFQQEREQIRKQLGREAIGTFEFIIVDDGSTDQTCSIVKGTILSQMKPQSSISSNATDSLKLIRFKRNRGKGAAVKIGMLHATGEYILMVDADGATDIRDLFKLLSIMTEMQQQQQDTQRPIVVIGSRAHLQEAAAVERSKMRTLLMYGFQFCVAMFCSRRIKDTQCGFKLFTSSAARMLFSNLHLQRWAFDIELVAMTELLQIPIAEVGVRWREVDGSKLDTGSKWRLIFVSLGMLRDMICVRLCYTLGFWKLKN